MTATEMECVQCGGMVRPLAGSGRMFEYRPGISLEIPVDFSVSTCELCGETYLTDRDAAELEKRLSTAYASYCGELIDAVRERAGVTLRQVEKAAGVTPTYLSHVTSGRKLASLTLIRLLQAYAIYPKEVHRHLAGNDWRSSYVHGDAKARLFESVAATHLAALAKKLASFRLAHAPVVAPSYVFEKTESSCLESLPPKPSSEAA